MQIPTPLIERSVLANGCRVVTIYTPWIPRVDISVRVPAGGGHGDKQGVAHALEHMVFKGPEGFTAEEFAKRLEATGGHMNAHTGLEETVYKIAVPGSDMALGMQSIGDMVLRPALPGNQWDKERQVIIEEIGREHDDLPRRAILQALRGQWVGHPLSHNVAGTKEDLEQMQIEDLGGFYNTHYDPSQMIVAVASPFAHREIIDALSAQGFDQARQRPATKAFNKAVPLLTPEQNHILHPSKQLMTVFLAPGPGALDYTELMALQPVHDYLSEGQSSRLFQEAREKRGLAYDVSGLHFEFRSNGGIGAFASTTNEKLEEFEQVVRQEFAMVAKDGLAPEVLADIKNRHRGELMMNAHHMSLHLHSAIRHEMYGWPQTLSEIAQDFDNLTSEQVAVAANKWFNPDKLSRVTLGHALAQERAGPTEGLTEEQGEGPIERVGRGKAAAGIEVKTVALS